MKRPLLMILLDAASIHYLSSGYMPFLYGFAKNNKLIELESLFAYRGIEATLFTGKKPNEHGIWTEFNKGENLIWKGKLRRAFVNFVDQLSNDRLSKKVRSKIEKRANLVTTRHVIPVSLLAQFRASQPHKVYEDKYLNNLPTLFDIIKKKKKTFVYIAPPLVDTDEDIFNQTLMRLNSGEWFDFWYLKFSSLDWIGHKFGPNSNEIRRYLIFLDEQVKQLINKFESKYKNPNIIVISDHGMCPVRNYFDFYSIIKAINLRVPEDFTFFIDSTMIRFWFNNENAQVQIESRLNSVKCGQILDFKSRGELYIPKERKYGDLLFALKVGNVVQPSFWYRSTLVKGMHGYAHPIDDYSSPILIVRGDCDLTDKVGFDGVFYLIKQLMGFE